MAEETEISTPGQTELETTTSTDEVADTTTSDVEVNANDVTAEKETEEGKITSSLNPPPQGEEELYAGKYKTVDELVKGYQELQKSYTKGQQIKAKYDELLKQQETREAIRLERAKEQGFNSVQEQEIADKLTVNEFNAYVNALNTIDPENYEAVRQNLLNYYNTANRAYLDEAKKYYPSSFIEQVALRKQGLENKLQGEIKEKAEKAERERIDTLGKQLKEDFAEFLGDIRQNTGKAKALEMFCNAGFINSKEDMQVFADVCNQISQFAKDNAIKEYEAQKAIEKTKAAARIESDISAGDVPGTMPTLEQLGKMTQKQYDKAVATYGVEKLFAQAK